MCGAACKPQATDDTQSLKSLLPRCLEGGRAGGSFDNDRPGQTPNKYEWMAAGSFSK